jgi:putative heme-binding domain-containing protein
LIVSGNHTDPPEPFQASRIPANWGEDLLLPRQWDANGHARGRLAPGGWIARTGPDGKRWEIVSVGYRNAYDIALNAEGELFAYDSDMEWDMGTPWYRPTRVTHATSGSEFGWRSGTGKWPAYYADSLPPLLDIGPGSPVGVEFGYGTRFPAKYQKALYICDWTFGTMYALHLEPDGSTYRAVKEEFVSRTPLPLTDVAVGPDGSLYFTIGGRGTQSELFRVRYVGEEPTAPADLRESRGAELRALRRQIEAYHAPAADGRKAVEFVSRYLGHPDRFIRYAARVALEHQKVGLWRDRVLAETDPEALLNGAIALARQGDRPVQPRLLEALGRLDLAALPEFQGLELLRAYSLAFIRLGEPDAATAARLVARLDPLFPAKTDALNRELCALLVYLKSPTVVAKTIDLLKKETKATVSIASEELLARNRGYGGTIAQLQANAPDLQKLHYVFVLRNAREGWTMDRRAVYFRWLEGARGKSGGASYLGFLNNIERDAFDNATDAERLAIEAAGLRKPYRPKELPKPVGPGRDWKLTELVAFAEPRLKGRNFKNGERSFAAARCVVCHRFGGDGGATGPDLTQAAGRFTLRDLCESIVEPSKVVSDQYRASVVTTESGRIYTGRIVNETKDGYVLVIDPEDSTKVVELKKKDVESVKPSAVSLMPQDLLKTLNENEVLDLLAYLLSRGDPGHPMFKK